VTLLADITGSSETAGTVTINAVDDNQRATAAAISLDGVTGLTIDGITAQGGTEESILVLNSPDTVIRNCTAVGSQGDGVFVESSNSAVVFDNLTYTNRSAGIRVYGSSNVQVVNNTIYGNHGIGLFIGTAADPSIGIVVENNIINSNTGVGFDVEQGNDVTSDYNLNTDGYAGNASAGAHDIAADPLFVAGGTDFHLSPQLDDCTGGSPAVNAGDPDTAVDFIATLQQRTTREDQAPDCVGPGCCTTVLPSPTPVVVDLQPGQVDLGYHYPGLPPTPTPKATRTAGKTKTPTRTPTRTPTV